MPNEISSVASKKLARLKRPFSEMSPEEQLEYTIALRARRRAPERPIKVRAAKAEKPIKKARGKANAKTPEDQKGQTSTASGTEEGS